MDKKYTLTVTAKQLRLLNVACDTLGRIYRGMPDTCTAFEAAIWERRPDDWGDKHAMLTDTLRLLRHIINPKNTTDPTGQDDILHDMHQVIRTHLYYENGGQDDGSLFSGVTRYSEEPMIEITTTPCPT
jgi:hypothetical protein